MRVQGEDMEVSSIRYLIEFSKSWEDCSETPLSYPIESILATAA
jgi:hypothetical protein